VGAGTGRRRGERPTRPKSAPSPVTWSCLGNACAQCLQLRADLRDHGEILLPLDAYIDLSVSPCRRRSGRGGSGRARAGAQALWGGILGIGDRRATLCLGSLIALTFGDGSPPSLARRVRCLALREHPSTRIARWCSRPAKAVPSACSSLRPIRNGRRPRPFQRDAALHSLRGAPMALVPRAVRSHSRRGLSSLGRGCLQRRIGQEVEPRGE
jgi:hypothetical protein